jgi:hypothetical protein
MLLSGKSCSDGVELPILPIYTLWHSRHLPSPLDCQSCLHRHFACTARPRGCALDSLPSFYGYNGRQVAPGGETSITVAYQFQGKHRDGWYPYLTFRSAVGVIASTISFIVTLLTSSSEFGVFSIGRIFLSQTFLLHYILSIRVAYPYSRFSSY